MLYSVSWKGRKHEVDDLKEEIVTGDEQYEVKTVVERFQTPHNHAIVRSSSAISSGLLMGLCFKLYLLLTEIVYNIPFCLFVRDFQIDPIN